MTAVDFHIRESPLRAAARRRPLTAFVILTLVLSWVLWPIAGPEMAPLPFGPLLAATIVAGLIGGRRGVRQLLSRMVRWRVGSRWYGIALGLPCAIIAVGVLGLLALGVTTESSPDFRWFLLAPLVAEAIVSPLQGALGEELGWRGYLLPPLQRNRSALVAALLVGGIQVGWHLPLFLTGKYGLANLLFQFAFAILVAWVFNSTRGSVLMAMIVHGAFNGASAYAFMLFAEPDQDLLMWAMAAVTWAVVMAVIAFAGPADLSRRVARDTDSPGSMSVPDRSVPVLEQPPLAQQ